MKTKTKKLTVEVDVSSWRWLRALARANAKSDLPLANSTPEGILAQAAFCFADAAGRRSGSWEADVGRNLLYSSGFQTGPTGAACILCRLADARENEAARRAWEAQRNALRGPKK